MPNDNRQKIKLLKMMEILRQETDENHPLTTAQLCKKINDFGITANLKTIGQDIVVLNQFGFEVMSVMIGREKAFYVSDRTFGKYHAR